MLQYPSSVVLKFFVFLENEEIQANRFPNRFFRVHREIVAVGNNLPDIILSELQKKQECDSIVA